MIPAARGKQRLVRPPDRAGQFGHALMAGDGGCWVETVGGGCTGVCVTCPLGVVVAAGADEEAGALVVAVNAIG